MLNRRLIQETFLQMVQREEGEFPFFISVLRALGVEIIARRMAVHRIDSATFQIDYYIIAKDLAGRLYYVTANTIEGIVPKLKYLRVKKIRDYEELKRYLAVACETGKEFAIKFSELAEYLAPIL